MLKGNYSDLPDDKATDYELYKETSDKLTEYDIKDLFVQDKLNIKNNVDTTNDSWNNSTNSNELEILFRKEDNNNYKFKIKKEGSKVSIIINTGNSVLSQFMNTQNNINGTTSSKAIIMLNDMLTDAFVRLLVQKDVNTFSQSAFSKSEPIEVVNDIYTLHDNKIKQVEDMVFDIIKKLLARRKEIKNKLF